MLASLTEARFVFPSGTKNDRFDVPVFTLEYELQSIPNHVVISSSTPQRIPCIPSLSLKTGNGDIDGLATATNGCEKLVLK